MEKVGSRSDKSGDEGRTLYWYSAEWKGFYMQKIIWKISVARGLASNAASVGDYDCRCRGLFPTCPREWRGINIWGYSSMQVQGNS